MGTVGGRGFGGSVKFADGKTSSANVPHLGPIHTKNARLFRRVLSVPEHSHLKQKNAGRRMNTSAVIGLDVITC